MPAALSRWLFRVFALAALAFTFSAISFAQTRMQLVPAAGSGASSPVTEPASGFATKASPDPSRAGLISSYGQMQLSFEVNRGQTDSRVKFLSRGRGYTLFLNRRGEAELVLQNGERKRDPQQPAALACAAAKPQPESANPPAVLRIKLLDAKANRQVEGFDELPGKANYFIGDDPTKWRANVPTYGRVRVRAVYPGVDLVYYGNKQQLEHDFIVAPGANPSLITLALEGAEEESLDSQGNLVVTVGKSELRFQRPVIYQETAGIRKQISGGYVLKAAHEIGFQVGAYDPREPLVIDPVLSYSSYLGGAGNDFGLAIAVDSAGSSYVTGQTSSANFRTTAGAFQTSLAGGPNAFIAKFTPDGTALVYATYLGGSGAIDPFSNTNQGDVGRAIAVDSAGHAYVTGQTSSTNFPTTSGAFQTALAGEGSGCSVSEGDAFVTELNTTGSGLVYSTYLGGSLNDHAFGIAIDPSGNAYVTGRTLSTDFPTTPGAYRTTFDFSASDCSCSGDEDVFVTKLNPTGTALVYSTYIGGGLGQAIAIDPGGNAYITGTTNSPSYPTTAGSFRTSPISAAGGCSLRDAIVTKLSAAGSALVYSTYLGGSGEDVANGLALDGSGNAYVTGTTNSADFPTTSGVLQTVLAGSRDAFVTKLDPTGSSLRYSTYLGGLGSNQFGNGIAVDGSGNAYVGGYTDASSFPITPNVPQPAFGGGAIDGFVSQINATGSSLQFSTFLGGSGTDGSFGIALDSFASIYVAGVTTSSNFPVTSGAFQTTLAGTANAFVAKIVPIITTTTALSSSENPSVFGQSMTFTAIVSPGYGSRTPTGTVSFGDGALTLGTSTLSGGQASFTTSSLSVGSHNITAAYGGDANFTASTSTVLPQTVNKASTATVLTSSPNPSVLNKSVTFTATVSVVAPGAGSPTGTVVFNDGGTTLATVALSAAGTATYTTSALTVDSHSITSVYSGDGNFNGSSGSLTQNVEYFICVLYDQSRTVHGGATFPIKVVLCDANGGDVSSAGIVLHATAVTAISGFSGTPDSPGNANPDSDFRFGSTLGTTGGYIFNLSTGGLAAGTYSLQFTAGSDPVTHAVLFGVAP